VNTEIPFQLEQIIKSLGDTRENIHIRGNYRTRLSLIRDILDTAIMKYDDELFLTNTKKNKWK
jgi:hypothetical protein